MSRRRTPARNARTPLATERRGHAHRLDALRALEALKQALARVQAVVERLQRRRH